MVEVEVEVVLAGHRLFGVEILVGAWHFVEVG